MMSKWDNMVSITKKEMVVQRRPCTIHRQPSLITPKTYTRGRSRSHHVRSHHLSYTMTAHCFKNTDRGCPKSSTALKTKVSISTILSQTGKYIPPMWSVSLSYRAHQMTRHLEFSAPIDMLVVSQILLVAPNVCINYQNHNTYKNIDTWKKFNTHQKKQDNYICRTMGVYLSTFYQRREQEWFMFHTVFLAARRLSITGN